MSNSDLDDLAAELAEFAPPEKKKGRPASEERIIAGFEEIQRFADQHGRAPQHGEDRRSSSASMQCGSTGYAVSQTAVPC